MPLADDDDPFALGTNSPPPASAHQDRDYACMVACDDEDVIGALATAVPTIAAYIVSAKEALSATPSADLDTVSKDFGKFAKFTFAFGDLRHFDGGLDERIGAPSEHVEAEMKRGE